MMNRPDPAKLYLDLLKRCLLGLIYEDKPVATFATFDAAGTDFNPKQFDRELREIGQDWPGRAHSMIGLRRMDSLEECIERVLADGVPGDLIETGVWRGGAAIFMRAVLKARGVTDRTVWAADSFEGLPRPNRTKYPADVMDFSPFNKTLGVSLEEVRQNFDTYGLLDDQVRFLKGWFKDTLPGAPLENLAILRLDGDMYESTMDALSSLYPKLSPGGFCIIDDYNISSCVKAVEDYRTEHGITEGITRIDNSGVFWRRH